MYSWRTKLKLLSSFILIVIVLFFIGCILRFFGFTNEMMHDLIMILLGGFLGYHIGLSADKPANKFKEHGDSDNCSRYDDDIAD